MRAISLVLLALNALIATAQQPAASNLVPSGKLSIPARLTRTVRADKVHPGGPVEFRTLEPVLVGKGLVMPENTLLQGRILSAGPKQEGRNSWLVLVVERAEWKQHSLQLRAFITAQITLPSDNDQSLEPGSTGNTSSNLRGNRQNVRWAAKDTLSSMIKPTQDATAPGPDEVSTRHPLLENVGIMRDKDGTTYLFSSKANVKLPAGVLLMLTNEPVASSEAADAKAATAASAPERQP